MAARGWPSRNTPRRPSHGRPRTPHGIGVTQHAQHLRQIAVDALRQRGAKLRRNGNTAAAIQAAICETEGWPAQADPMQTIMTYVERLQAAQAEPRQMTDILRRPPMTLPPAMQAAAERATAAEPRLHGMGSSAQSPWRAV